MEDRILLVYNYWEWDLKAILSLLIRMVTGGPNHCAAKKDDIVHEMVGSEVWWMIKKALGKPVSYEPNEGSGYRTTPYEDWLIHKDRIVIEMIPDKPLVIPKVTEGYGFIDLIQIFFQIVRTKWFMGGNKWNGRDGTRFLGGWICSEFTEMCRQKETCWGVLPIDILLDRTIEKGIEFETRKRK